ncbi:MAG: AAA family ATPase [Treponema sp.]|nr:AAA family ATPase [Treponema sp.]
MLKRDILGELAAWKNRPHHPLVLKGLRQIGKTFTAKKFGNEFYENVVYLDLRANRSVHRAFEGDFDIDRMVLSISAAEPSARFVPGRTLIIMDEIQDCPNARSSLKYWDLDGRFDVLCTGSFLGVKGFRSPYERGVPVGYEEQLTMYPLTFREFILNTGMNAAVLAYIQKSIREKTPVEQTIHESMRQLYLQYLIVGGMPEAVNTFFATHDLNAVRAVQKGILLSIRDDFGRYKDKNGNDRINEVLKLRAEACLDSLPAQLAKEYKKFQYSLVNAKGHSPEKAEGLCYLEDVGLVVRAYNTRELASPLEGAKIPEDFKAFYIDTGLLVSQLGEDVPARILSGDLGAYKGAIAENMVASSFAKNGRDLFYYHAPSGSPELDFIFEQDGKVVIVECKSSNNRATSMKFVLANPHRFGEHPAMKIADANIGQGKGFDSYPLYSLGFMQEDNGPGIVEMPDVAKLSVPKSEDSLPAGRNSREEQRGF